MTAATRLDVSCGTRHKTVVLPSLEENTHGRSAFRRVGTWALTAGANGDGRFNTVGGVVKHVFPAEQREE